jgi:hypothetical protein
MLAFVGTGLQFCTFAAKEKRRLAKWPPPKALPQKIKKIG